MPKTTKTSSKMDSTLLEIARKELNLETLETRRSDSLDFHDTAVWCVRAALEAAYRAGLEAGKRGR